MSSESEAISSGVQQNQVPPDLGQEDEVLTKEQLRVRLKLKTIYAVDHLVRQKIIPKMKLGRKSPRFYWPEVKAALARRTTKAATATR